MVYHPTNEKERMAEINPNHPLFIPNGIQLQTNHHQIGPHQTSSNEINPGEGPSAEQHQS